MKSNVMTVVLLVVIGASAVWLFYYYRSQPEPGETVLHLMPVACAGCGETYQAMVGDEPAVCLYCKKRTAWRGLKCRAKGCGAVFPFVRESDEAARRESAVCAKCGSSQVGEVPGNDPAVQRRP